jgi:hypothetical protein
LSELLFFPAPRFLLLRRSPVVRLAALFTVLAFAAAVVWTSVVSMGSYCLTSDSYAPLPRVSH